MSYETTKFGNGVLTGSGGNVTSNVHSRFGTVGLGQQAGIYETDGAEWEVSLTITGEQLVRDAATNDGFLVPLKLPVGAVVKDVIAQVKSAFTLTGTTPTILIGTEGSEGTNGVSISQAQAQAVGTYVLTLNGTWASPIAASTQIGMALGGTSPVSAKTGSMDIVIRYLKA